MQGGARFPVKTKQRPKPEKDELDRKEWDFSSIPESEIEACFIYEYARELARRSPRISALFAIGQIACSAGHDEGRKAHIRNIMTACFPDFPTINEDWFPGTPWQGLDQKVRSALVGEVNNGPQHYWNSLPIHKLSIETMKFDKNVGANGTLRYVPQPFREEDISQTESGFFAINWNYPDAELRRAFAKWLSEERKDRVSRGLTEIKYKRKRGGFIDRLRSLGALRVVNHYRTNQLVDYEAQDAKLKVAAPYRYSSDLYESAKKAGKLLDMLLLRSTGRS
jgi:hypothetical protein